MISLLKKEILDQSDIELIIKNQTEESTYLEFKSADSLINSDRNKFQISREVSAFANSDGGLLIYGIKESDHKAVSLDFIDGIKVTKEWIENVIDSNIKRTISDLRINPIRFNSNIEKTVYVIKIPNSLLSPHIANDNRFYRRSNFKILPMEEYEIRNLYNKRLVTKLFIENLIITVAGSSRMGEKIKEIDYLFTVQVKNVGLSIENNYKMEIHIPYQFYQTCKPNYNTLQKYQIRIENGFSVFSIPNSSPIFQNEITTVLTFPLSFSRSNFSIINDFGIKLKLYYTSGTEEKQIDIIKLLSSPQYNLIFNDFY